MLTRDSRASLTFILRRVQDKRSFTLIELLIVIAIVAVLSTVVLITLNPAELLKQARDSNRLSEISALNSTFNILSADIPSPYFGDERTIYVSIPDAASSDINHRDNCPGIRTQLPQLPDVPTPNDWKYDCSPPASFRKVNGTGWIPVDFTVISSGAPFSALPVDPTNDIASGKYYTYVASANGKWVLTSLLESTKYLSTNAVGDAGTDDARLEMGNDFSLWKTASGLSAYWRFNEGSGSTAADASGGNFTLGNINITPSWPAGKTGSAIHGGGLSSHPQVASPGFRMASYSLAFWLKVSGSSFRGIFSRGDIFGIGVFLDGSDKLTIQHRGAAYSDGLTTVSPITPPGQWRHIVITFDIKGAGFNNVVSQIMKIFVDGIEVSITPTSANPRIPDVTSFPLNIAETCVASGCSTPMKYAVGGGIDEVRVYNRALAPFEVSALYNATK